MNFLTRWNTSVQLGVLVGTLVLISSAAIGWTTYQQLNRHLVDAELRELRREAELAAARFDEQLHDLRTDARLLALAPPTSGHLRAVGNDGIDPQDGTSTPSAWISRLESIFRRFMQENPAYLQIRFLAREPDGLELLRLEARDSEIVRISDSELPQKGDRYYFREAMQMADTGETYLSRLDLNQDNGAVTLPPVPVVRAVAPVYLPDGSPVAAIVINVAMDTFFDVVEQNNPEGRKFFVADDTGDFIAHPNPERRFATELGHRHRLADQWSELADDDAVPATSYTFTSLNSGDKVRAVGVARQQDALGLRFILSGDLDFLYPELIAARDEVVKTSLIILIVALAATLLMARIFAARLRALARGAKEVAAGNYELALADPGEDEVGELAIAMSGMASDIREKIDRLQFAEQQLGKNSRLLEAFIQNAPIMIFVKDAAELRFEQFNKAAEDITGFSAAEMLGKNDFDFFPEDEARHFTEVDRRVLASDGVVVVGDETITRQDGTQRLLHTKKVAIRGDAGRPISLLGISEDVTDLRQAERRLAFSEQRFRNIVDAAAEGIVTIDEQGTVLTFNQAATQIFGYGEEEVVGRNVSILMPDPDRSRHDGYIAKYLSTGNAKVIGVGREVVGVRRNGTTFPMRLSIGEVTTDGHSTFTGVAHDLTVEKESERRLVAAMELAEKANRAKSDFLATMSHELRTPLNAIIGYSEMLVEDAEKGDSIEDLSGDLDKIRSAGRHLLGLINDVLDLSKIEAGSVELDVTAFSAEVLMQEVVDTTRPLIEKNGNRFDVEIEGDIGQVQTDSTRVRQILINLLGNAAKFTRNGSVRLAVSLLSNSGQDERALLIEVCDTGIGIEKQQLEHIFMAFSQADASTSRDFGGTGLGLAITRGFCELLGGTINVRSVPGKGSTFSVMLPVNLPQSAVDDDPIPHADKGEAMLRRSGTILVIEDDQAARDLLVGHLRAANWTVAEASTGVEGLIIAQRIRPCAIVLDVIMPELDGWAVLKILKNDPELSQIPVVLCTIVDDQKQGFALGAADYLLKPVKRRDLVATLSRYCTDPPCNLLIAEDDLPTQELFSSAAQGLGWSVRAAADGAEALASVRRQKPDLILLDLMMPNLDGFDVVDELQRNADWRDIPVVVVTAKELTAEDRRRLSGFVETVVSKRERDLDELVSYVLESLAQSLSGRT